MTDRAIVLVCHDRPFGRAMAAAMHKRFGTRLAGVLAIRRGTSRIKELRRKLAGTLKTPRLEKQVLKVERKLEHEAALAFDRLARPPDHWPSGVIVQLTENPNNQDSVAWLERISPEIIAVSGAPILRPEVFNIARLGALNMHSSLLPDDRGSHAEFWQVLEGRTDRAGVTIHYIDEGVDTGRIVLQRPTESQPDVSPQILRTLNALVALEAMPDAIVAVLEGRAAPKPQEPGTGPTRRTKDRSMALRVQLLAKLGHLTAARTEEAQRI